MKYIMLETENGQKLPIIFPDVLTHSLVAGAIQLAVDALSPEKDLRPQQCERLLASGSAPPVSAGFISLGLDVTVSGLSESLGELKHNPSDAARVMIGESVQFMPDAMALMLLDKLRLNEQLRGDKRRTKGAARSAK